MKKIVRRAVEQHLLGPDSSLLACPSPNCEGVFRRFLFDFDVVKQLSLPGLALKKNCKKERHSSVSSVDQKYAGGLISSSLMCIICSPWFRCKSVFHNGMTCQFYQLIQADDNHSLRVSVYPNICAHKLKFFHNISKQVWLAEKPEERKLCTGCQVSSLLFISISTVANDASLHNDCCSDSPPLLLYWFLLGTNREGWGMSPCPLCQVRIQFHEKG